MAIIAVIREAADSRAGARATERPYLRVTVNLTDRRINTLPAASRAVTLAM